MNDACLQQRVLELLAGGVPMTVRRVARLVSATSYPSDGTDASDASDATDTRAVARAVRELERRGAVGVIRADIDGRSEWLSWAPGDPRVLLSHAGPATPPRHRRDLDLDARDAPDALDSKHRDRETPSLWTLHAAPFANADALPVSVRRRAKLEADGFLSFRVAGRPSGLVNASELALRGHAVSCAARSRAWHLILHVFDHSPTPDERRAWSASRGAHRIALSSTPAHVWIIVPGDPTPAQEDRAVRCSTRPVSCVRFGRGSRRTDLEVRTPRRGFEGFVIDGLDLAVRGFTSLKIGASVFIVCATLPDADTLARCARARSPIEEASLRADAAAFLAPSAKAGVGSPIEALVVLGLGPTASASDVARAFRRRVIAEQAHPDLGGSADEFAELIRLRDLALTRIVRS